MCRGENENTQASKQLQGIRTQDLSIESPASCRRATTLGVDFFHFSLSMCYAWVCFLYPSDPAVVTYVRVTYLCAFSLLVCRRWAAQVLAQQRVIIRSISMLCLSSDV